MKMRCPAWLLGVTACAAIVCCPDTARAQANGFGERLQLIVSADRLLPVFSYSRTSVTDNSNNVTTTTSTDGPSLSLLWGGRLGPDFVHTIPRVGVDFTIIDRLTLGGSVVFAFGLGGSQTTKTEPNNGGQVTERTVDAPTTRVIGFAPRVGYILPLTEILAIWPRAGFAFYSVRTKQEIVPQNPNQPTRTEIDRDSIFAIDLDPQLAIVPMRNFFINVGPLINIPIPGSRTHEETQGAQTTSTTRDLSVFQIGVTAGLGGWFQL